MVKDEQLVTLKVATVSKKLITQMSYLTLSDWDKGVANVWINEGTVLGWIKLGDYKVTLRELNGEYRLDSLHSVSDGVRQIFMV